VHGGLRGANNVRIERRHRKICGQPVAVVGLAARRSENRRSSCRRSLSLSTPHGKTLPRVGIEIFRRHGVGLGNQTSWPHRRDDTSACAQKEEEIEVTADPSGNL
jgi:hypothetical protein